MDIGKKIRFFIYKSDEYMHYGCPDISSFYLRKAVELMIESIARRHCDL